MNIPDTLFWDMVLALRFYNDDRWKTSAAKRTEFKIEQTIQQMENYVNTCGNETPIQ